MRIALFSECYSPVTNGVVTSVVTLRETLQALGHTVYVFAPGTPQPDDDADVFRLPELPFPRHPYHFARPFPRLNFDFHCQHPFTVGRLGADIAKKYHLPMVYTAHSLYDTMATCSKSPIVRTMGPKAARGLIRRFCDRADYVIAPTRHTRDALKADGVRARYAVVPSGVIPPVVSEGARERLRGQYGIADETPLLLYVGRLGPEKRLDLLLRAIANLQTFGLPEPLNDFRLAIVGEGQCGEELEYLAGELRITDRVIFAGGHPHATIGDWYAAGDIFTMPSPAETQGLVLVEAMNVGLPCLAVDRGGTREVVEQGETGLRVPMDSGAFARALDFLLRNPQVCENLGQNGKIRALEYSPETMTRHILDIYERVLQLPRKTSPDPIPTFRKAIKLRQEKARRRARRSPMARNW
jgi:1,2-diacylglycerol 3-alpha-glucosyltransferase